MYCIIGIEITFIREIIDNTITRDQQHKDELIRVNKTLIVLEKKRDKYVKKMSLVHANIRRENKMLKCKNKELDELIKTLRQNIEDMRQPSVVIPVIHCIATMRKIV